MINAKRGAQIIDKTGYLSAAKGAVDLLPAERQQLIKDAYPSEAIDNIKWFAPLKSYVNEINSEMEERFKGSKITKFFESSAILLKTTSKDWIIKRRRNCVTYQFFGSV